MYLKNIIEKGVIEGFIRTDLVEVTEKLSRIENSI